MKRTPLLPEAPLTTGFSYALGVVMRRMRKDSGLSDRELSHVLGAHPAYSRIMSSGMIYPGSQYVSEYAAACGVPLGEAMRRAWLTEDALALVTPLLTAKDVPC